jgi:hypothetical protein
MALHNWRWKVLSRWSLHDRVSSADRFHQQLLQIFRISDWRYAHWFNREPVASFGLSSGRDVRHALAQIE